MAIFVTRTVGDVVAELVMSRTNFAGTLLLVEGDTDSKFWSPRTDGNRRQIVIAGSKTTVIGAVIRANAQPLTGVLGIVDDDYDSLCGTAVAVQNVLRLDARDLEVLLIRSPALERVMQEDGDAASISALEAAEGKPLRQAILDRAILFGKLRWLSKQRGWNFDFDEHLRPFRVGAVATWHIDEAQALAVVAGAVGLSVAQLTTELNNLPVADAYFVLHGRDTIAVIAMGLRGVLAGQQHPVERIALMLRLAFDGAMANATQIFQSIRAWELANVPYRVLL